MPDNTSLVNVRTTDNARLADAIFDRHYARLFEAALAHENDVYAASPIGGDASRY